MSQPPHSSLKTPEAKPLVFTMISEGVVAGDEQSGPYEVVTGKVSGHLLRIVRKQLVGSGDLFGGPKFIRVHLPEEAFGSDICKGRIYHFQLSIPKQANRLAVDRYVAWEIPAQSIQVF